MYEKVIHNTEELNAMAAHLRMAQNFPELRLLAAERLVPEQDVEDFTKEYFNVLCGHIASRLFQVTKVASRFEIPEFYTGRYQPEDQKEQFAICYSSDKNEGARLSHFTSESE